jgi:hypothetical protein
MNLCKLVVGLCVAVTASGALAQSSSGWVQLDKRPERKIVERPGDGSVTTNTVSVDLFYSPKINKKGDLATVSVLSNVEGMAGGNSATFDFEFDCKKNVFNIVKGAIFEGKMGAGKSQSLGEQLKAMRLPALPATDQVFENEDVKILYFVTTARTGSLKAIACDGQAVALYKQTIDQLEAKEVAAAALAEAKAQAEDAKAKAEEAKLAMCGQQTCKSLNRLATTSPIAESKWTKIESTPERGDLYYDSNIVTAKDVDINVQKVFFSMDIIPKKTTINMSRLLVNLPPSAMAAASKVLIDEWETTAAGETKKRAQPLVAKSLVFNYEFDCGANIFRISNSAAYSEADAKGSLVKTSAFSGPMFGSPTADAFEPVVEQDGKPRGNWEQSAGTTDEKGNQTNITYLVYSPAGLLKTFCSAASGAPPASTSAVVAPAPAVTGTQVSAPTAQASTSAAVVPAAASAKSKITEIMTSIGEFQPARGFGGKYWAYIASEGSVYLKEVENTDKSIVLEGYGLQFAIDPMALRMTYTMGATRKAANIDEAKSSVELHSYTQLKFQGGELTFQEDPTNGPMNVWLLKASDGAISELVDLGAGDLFYDPVKNIQIAVDLKGKTITFDVKGQTPSVKKITAVTSEVSQATGATPPSVASSPAGSKATEVLTSLGSFFKVRGSGGKYWGYVLESGDGWMTLKETENTDKAIVLEGYGLKFTIDPVGLRMTYTAGTSRKSVNIDEIKEGVNVSSFTELQFSDGQMNFKEDPNGPMDAWLVTPKTGAGYQLVDQGWGLLYDPIRNIQITVDLDEKKLSLDSSSKKPSVQKILNFK